MTESYLIKVFHSLTLASPSVAYCLWPWTYDQEVVSSSHLEF